MVGVARSIQHQCGRKGLRRVPAVLGSDRGPFALGQWRSAQTVMLHIVGQKQLDLRIGRQPDKNQDPCPTSDRKGRSKASD